MRSRNRKQKTEVRKKISLLFVMVLFLTGCVRRQEYIYQEDTFKKVEETAKLNQIPEQKEEVWIGSSWEEDEFIRQCPVCLRRYPKKIEKCPYDGASLEKINE